MAINDIWQKIENNLNMYNTDIVSTFNPPANAISINKLEGAIGASLPEEFIQFLSIHNGQQENSKFLFDNNKILSVSEILMAWSTWCDLLYDGDFEGKISNPASEIQDGWWLKGWIPFATNGYGDFLCIDLNPSINGVMGQIIKVYHDVEDRTLESNSFLNWFSQFIEIK